MNNDSDTPAKHACLTQICWRWEGKGLKCVIVPATAPAGARQMDYQGISCVLDDILLTPSMVPGRHGLHGLSAVVTAVGVYEIAKGSAAILSPSMVVFLALVHL